MTTLRELLRYELITLLRQRATWIYAAALFGLSYLAITTFVTAAKGTVFNGPLAIAGATVIVSMLGLIVTAAISGGVATRDAQATMEPLLHTTPVRTLAYLAGRFSAAFCFNALLLVAVPLGLVCAGLSQRLEPAAAGPYRPVAYLGAYLLVGLPNAFTATAILFSLATLTRTVVASYAGALLLFLLAMVSEGILAEALGRWQLAALVDPFGFVAIRELVLAWTPTQKDTWLVAPQGSLLWNRLAWLTIGVAALALTHARFRRGPVDAGSLRTLWPRHRRSRAVSSRQPRAIAPVALQHVQRTFGLATQLRQARSICWQSFRAILLSRGALVLLVPSGFLALLAPALTVHMGTPLLPTTGFIISLVGKAGDLVLWIAAPFLIVVYAGELVWRERDTGLNDIADVTPVPDWVLLLGKFAGLTCVLVLLQSLMVAAGMFMQASMDYHHFEAGLYVRTLFGLQLVEYLLFAVLAFVVHVLVTHKYVGHLVVLLAYAFTTFAGPLGFEHHLLVYGGHPSWSYSDLRGFGPHAAPVLWFSLYWSGWALLLAVAARVFWPRGRDIAWAPRVEAARRRFRTAPRAAAAVSLAIIAGAGGFIFYNTNVLNAYHSTYALKAQRAEYERRYARYRGLPQPEVTATSLRVEIYPSRRQVEIRGSYTLANLTTGPIAAIHVVTAAQADATSLAFDRPATCRRADDGSRHDICTLAAPLEVGGTVTLAFDVRSAPHGFANSGVDASISADGTYFRQQQFLPDIGYQRRRELDDPKDRAAFGLASRAPVPTLDDAGGDVAAGVRRIAFEAVVGTEDGQIAVAPGELRRTWEQGGRRYFHYVTEAPIRNDVAFFSAAYAVHEARAGDVAIQIFHHPRHTLNLERMVRGVQASLAYFTRHFGPYPHRQIRLVEHAGRGSGLHSAPMNISFTEGFSQLNPATDPRGVDLPFAIVAHEVAHQWWGNLVTPAWAEGGAVITESVAWYAAMAVVEETYGEVQLARLLGMLREAYMTPQSRAAVPLLRAHSWFLAYRKGPFAMYALREYVGAAQVDGALRRLFEKHAAGSSPLPTSVDLYRELQAVTPAPLQQLLADLFETNTYWELTATRAAAVPDGRGAWQVSLDFKARKVVVDLDGVEHEVPMDDPVEVGVYGADGTLHRERHRLRSRTGRVVMTVPGRPVRAGIDPRHLLIDVKPSDNVIPFAS